MKVYEANEINDVVLVGVDTDGDKCVIDRFTHDDNWQMVKDATMNTIGKNTGAYPDPVWKKQLLLSEHSPIRLIKFNWRWSNLKSWVSVHFTRHKIGIDHFVVTQRTDRTGVNRDESPQGTLVKHVVDANAQAIINVSRKRLCKCASEETQQSWILFKNDVKKVEPELASVMVPECVYRGFCPEMFGCGFDKTAKYRNDLIAYRDIHNTIV